MKILVGNNAMGNPGGSETYSYAIIKELVSRGHEVACYTTRRGMVVNEVEKLGVPVYFEPTSIALCRNIKAFKIQTCHGIFPKLEQPVSGMNAYVSISEEVQNHLSNKRVNSTLIRNGIDCERFQPVKPINKRLKTILSLSHSDGVNNILRVVCRNINCELIIHNKYKTPIWNIEEKINEADLVISLGRGAYEAMACGRNVLVFDNRGYVKGGNIGDGILTKDNWRKSAHNNCSGRATNKEFRYEDLISEVFCYSKNKGKDLRKIALNDFNIEKQVNQYLSLIR